VGQNVGFGLELKGRPKAEIKEEVEKIMAVMNLKDLSRRRPGQFLYRPGGFPRPGGLNLTHNSMTDYMFLEFLTAKSKKSKKFLLQA
jgi:hypothetical protein